MGRFSCAYLASQAIFGAWLDDELIAFISCHKSPETWTLDIMRCQPNAPSGTMYALTWHAIEAAQAHKVSVFSLASTTYSSSPVIKTIDKFSLRVPTNTAGLEQFKRAFAPTWRPLYAAAPTKLALGLALWDIWQEVHDPPPLKAPKP